MSITMKAWFRSIAAAFKSEAAAQSVAGIAILALAIYTGEYISIFSTFCNSLTSNVLGFTIPKPSMIGALRWITYINVSSNPIETMNCHSPTIFSSLSDTGENSASIRIRAKVNDIA